MTAAGEGDEALDERGVAVAGELEGVEVGVASDEAGGRHFAAEPLSPSAPVEGLTAVLARETDEVLGAFRWLSSRVHVSGQGGIHPAPCTVSMRQELAGSRFDHEGAPLTGRDQCCTPGTPLKVVASSAPDL